MITQVSVIIIEEIAHEIQKIDYDCNKLGSLINGEIKYQKVSDTYNKIIIAKVSDNIKTVVVDCDSSKIKSIAFYGSLNIQANEIFYLFKDYREHYSVYDDLYFYFFNEDKKSGNYILSFFDSSPKTKIQEGVERLSNLMLSW